MGVNLGKIPLDKNEKILAAQCDEQEMISETKKMHRQIKEDYEGEE